MSLAWAFAFVLLFSTSVLGSEVCSNPKSTSDVLSCLDQNHPEVKKTTVDGRLAEGIVSSATQLPNPEIGFDSVRGSTLGETRGESRLSVSQLVEIGGKRSARARLGRATADSIRASSVVSVDRSRIENILKFVKYRQLVHEIFVLEEALATYEKVNRQFASRPRLSPDQQVSQGIFKLALGDYRHRLAALLSEKQSLESYFKVISELNFDAAIKFLPRRWKAWPKPETFTSSVQENPRLQVLEKNLNKADASYDLARANSWPDPTVSLIGQEDIEGSTQFRSYGVGVSLPLPLWNTNGGARQQASAEKYKAEVEFHAGAKALELERQNLLTSYKGFVSALEQSPDSIDTDRKHRNTETLFYRGVISGALVIEAHRQILDFTQTSHELELETLQTLLNLYSLDGKLGGFKYE